jgi:amino acid transporter
MQAFKSLLDQVGLSVLTPIIAVGLVVASVSGLIDWRTGPSTGLLDIARERAYPPRYFQELNSNGSSYTYWLPRESSSR